MASVSAETRRAHIGTRSRHLSVLDAHTGTGPTQHDIQIHNVTVPNFEIGLDVHPQTWVYIYDSVFTNNLDVGIRTVSTDDFEGPVFLWNSTVVRNGDGITGLTFVSEGRIVDNERHGLSFAACSNRTQKRSVGRNYDSSIVPSLVWSYPIQMIPIWFGRSTLSDSAS